MFCNVCGNSAGLMPTGVLRRPRAGGPSGPRPAISVTGREFSRAAALADDHSAYSPAGCYDKWDGDLISCAFVSCVVYIVPSSSSSSSSSPSV